MSLTDFVDAYIETMLWAETDDEGRPLDDAYTADDFVEEAIRQIREECQDFLEANADDIGEKVERAARDFFRTRNCRKPGFWDDDWEDGDWEEEAGWRLTQAARAFGTQGVNVGDDGRLYLHG